jgi:integrin-linked kinase
MMYFSDDHAFSLLHWASREGQLSIVDMLLARGARVNATNMGDDTSIHLAAAHGHRQVVVVIIFVSHFRQIIYREFDI